MVTIRAPEAGEWRLPPRQDPDNRALIVSRLSLAVTAGPRRPETGGELELEARLLEDGEPIARDDFLDLVQMRGTLTAGGSRPIVRELARPDAGPAYTTRVEVGERPGEATLLVEAEGRTFQRQRRLPLTIAAPPLAAEFAGLGAAAEAFTLFLEPVAAPAREGKVEVRVAAPDGSHRTLLARLEEGAATLNIPRTTTGPYEVEGRVHGLDAAGLPFEQRLGPWRLEGLAALPQQATPQAAAPGGDTDAPLVTDWSRVAWQVGIANLLAALLGLALQRQLARRAQAASRALTARIEAAMACSA
jgi:hypothetical protein